MQMPMIVITAGDAARIVDLTFGALFFASATHHTQCWPTEAGTEQRGQIGLSQRVQRRRVGVLGWP